MPKDNKPIVIGVLILVAIIFFTNSSNDMPVVDNSLETTIECKPTFNEDSRYDSVTFCTPEEATERAEDIGNCDGFHTHNQDSGTIYMSCEKHQSLDLFILGIGGGGY